jgi:predicted metal-dependent phosphoesterase TrpH
VIDLHLHTTASDGRSAPADLVAEAAAAGCHTIAVTDHDTVAGLEAAAAAAARLGLAFVPGIEVTAVAAGRDIHILGYYIDAADEALAVFLREQRAHRRTRVEQIGQRLKEIGAPVDIDALLATPIDQGRALGRPAIAMALVAAGHATDLSDAFDRYLSPGRPAFMARTGPDPREVIARIHAAGGIASAAHPGKLKRDDIVESMIAEGLDAVEVYHTDHTVADVVRYQELADTRGLLVTGGSDYHGPGSGRGGLGEIGLPTSAFTRLAGHLAGRR